MRSPIWQGSCVVVLSWLLLACASSKTAAPVDGVGDDQFVSTIPARQGGVQGGAPIQGGGYVVKKGDTLYSIAFNSGSDVPSLASLNNISPPYNIYPGQRLRFDSSSSVTTASRSASTYEVRRGDTLSSIGRQFGMAPQTLAQSNNLSAPYALQPGQVLNVQSAGGGSTQMVAATRPVTVTPVAVSQQSSGPRPLAEPSGSGQTTPFISQKSVAPAAPKEYAQVKEQKTSSSQSKLVWHWPAKGRIVEGFSVAEQGNKGIDIAGQKGQPVYAASSGKVVYAGSALRGYGKLIILKHDDDYLSAYAHNDELRVKEGDSVKGGSVIANMGSTDAPDVRLHFEIRYRGKSINPMSYLPKR
ncbi:peptidoglycan DD-metalloendopeptidase family protein [Aeromonas sobria]|uniref:Peptidoglycan-binding protein n=1 Tax=Aeromonas sobria TaxID=646 RepID=A0A1S2CNS3_AERSO|nr:MULTISPECIES: peptidoglycan DD-metalloendopeptidase family protein [Aeromonas]ATL93631.1 peptidoglycan-binding protein [Aeromonas sp. CU5]MBS4689538.1 peptidoglycan DD-metalloendopeptidase family protein [Aeromonas sobria]MCX7126561.1 peptidoglycan DD-metalloendopeptidase family protein [Aeromonas sp.]OHY90395.1 peptidoglycan-binding protein [Aeromonas sobria]